MARQPVHVFDAGSIREGDELVIFVWSAEHGHCDDCGIPAAYREAGPDDHVPAHFRLLCSVCAAMAASEGSTIIRLFEDD